MRLVFLLPVGTPVLLPSAGSPPEWGLCTQPVVTSTNTSVEGSETNLSLFLHGHTHTHTTYIHYKSTHTQSAGSAPDAVHSLWFLFFLYWFRYCCTAHIPWSSTSGKWYQCHSIVGPHQQRTLLQPPHLLLQPHLVPCGGWGVPEGGGAECPNRTKCNRVHHHQPDERHWLPSGTGGGYFKWSRCT